MCVRQGLTECAAGFQLEFSCRRKEERVQAAVGDEVREVAQGLGNVDLGAAPGDGWL